MLSVKNIKIDLNSNIEIHKLKIVMDILKLALTI